MSILPSRSRSSAPPVRRALLSNISDAGGSQLLTLTLDLLAVATLRFTATQVGLLNALGTISYLVLGVPLGAMVDARGPLRTLRASLAVKLLLAATTLTLLLSHHLGMTSLMLLGITFGVASVATETAQTSLVTHLTDDPAQVTDTVARMASADRLAAIACPALVGLGVARGAASWLFVASIALLGVAATALVRLWSAVAPAAAGEEPVVLDTAPDGATRRADEATERSRVRHPGSGALHGFRVLFADRTLRGVILLVTAGNVGLAIGDSVEAILVVRRLALGSAFFGLMGTIAAAAGLAASAVAPRLIRRRPLKSVFAVGGIAQAAVAALPLLALVLPALARPVLLVFALSWALVMTLCNIAGSAYTAAAVPRDALGRTSAAARTITMGSVPLAALGGGLMADVLGIAAPLVAWPALTLAAALAFLALGRTVPASA